MAWAPGSKYVSPDGRVTFDERGQRLDALGHGTGTYVNTDDLIPMSWLQPQEEQPRQQAAKQGVFQRAPGVGAQMRQAPPQQYAPPATAGPVQQPQVQPPAARAGTLPRQGFGEWQRFNAGSGQGMTPPQFQPPQAPPQGPQRTPQQANPWGMWTPPAQQQQAQYTPPATAAPPPNIQRWNPPNTPMYTPPAAPPPDPGYSVYDPQVQFQQMQPGDTYPFWLQNQIARMQQP